VGASPPCGRGRRHAVSGCGGRSGPAEGGVPGRRTGVGREPCFDLGCCRGADRQIHGVAALQGDEGPAHRAGAAVSPRCRGRRRRRPRCRSLRAGRAGRAGRQGGRRRRSAPGPRVRRFSNSRASGRHGATYSRARPSATSGRRRSPGGSATTRTVSGAAETAGLSGCGRCRLSRGDPALTAMSPGRPCTCRTDCSPRGPERTGVDGHAQGPVGRGLCGGRRRIRRSRGR